MPGRGGTIPGRGGVTAGLGGGGVVVVVAGVVVEVAGRGGGGGATGFTACGARCAVRFAGTATCGRRGMSTTSPEADAADAAPTPAATVPPAAACGFCSPTSSMNR
jgi:hypothetical protein